MPADASGAGWGPCAEPLRLGVEDSRFTYKKIRAPVVGALGEGQSGVFASRSTARAEDGRSDFQEGSAVRVVGYARVSTAEQATSGNGLDAQRAAIEAACQRKGWELVTVLEDRGLSGKSRKGRTALEAAIAMCEAGGAQALVAAKLDRLSRSLIDFAGLMEQARASGWGLCVLDCDFDTTTPQGELLANMLACFAQFERRCVSSRTKDALAAKRERGERVGGRPSTLPDRVVKRIQREAAAGTALNAIARGLNEDAIPTGQGGQRWYASTVRAVLRRTSPQQV